MLNLNCVQFTQPRKFIKDALKANSKAVIS
jgi:hypothetical protein